MPPSYSLPNALEHSQRPTLAETFPYGRKNNSGDEPTDKPAGFSVPFTDQEYELPVLSLSRLLENVHQEQKNNINANPRNYLAVVPYGAGQGWEAAFPSAEAAILAFLKGVDMPGKESIGLVSAKPGKKRSGFFDAPITLFIVNFTPEQREWLLWKRVFPLHEPGASFIVYPLDSEQPNWFLMKLSGDTVKEGGEAKKLEALARIKEKLWSTMKIQAAIRTITSNNPTSDLARLSTSVLQATVNATSSFRIIYLEPDNHRIYSHGIKEDDKHVYIILGHPVSSTKAEHDAFKLQLKSITGYTVDLRFMRPSSEGAGCVWCKSDLHPSHKCPMPNTGEGWYGPSSEDLEKTAKVAKGWKGPKEASENRDQRSPGGSRSGDRESPRRGRGSGGRRANPRGRGGRGGNRGRGGYYTNNDTYNFTSSYVDYNSTGQDSSRYRNDASYSQYRFPYSDWN